MPEDVIGLVGGTGAEGRGLAVRFALAGMRVVVGSRLLERARETIDALRARFGPLPLEAGDNRSILRDCSATLLTVPFAHAAAILEAHRDDFRAGSLLVDVTVPVGFEGGKAAMIEVAEGSGAEHLRGRLRADVALAVAFKTIPAALLARPGTALDCDDFVCGDSPDARARTMDLLRVIPGLRPIDAGPLSSARTIEGLTLLAIRVNRRYKVREARFRMVGVP